MIEDRPIEIKTINGPDHYAQLYVMLAERDSDVNISHKKMPTWTEHLTFVKSSPYKEWFLVMNSDLEPIGQFYITDKNEIGIQVLKKYQGKKYGTAILDLIVNKRYGDEELLANINPNNVRSINLFQKFGFCHIQNTYRRYLTKP